MSFRFTPSCCCGPTETCLIFEDLFERADSSSVGSDWSEDAGNWSIASGKLTVAAASGKSVLSYTSVPSSQNYRLYIDIGTASAGDAVLGIIGYSSTASYYFARLFINSSSGQIKLYSRSGGVDTQLAQSATFDSTLSEYLSVCHRDGLFSARTGQVESMVSASITPPSSSRTFAVGVDGTVSAGDVTFGFVEVKFVSDDCESCAPGNCCDSDGFDTYCMFDEDGPPQQVRVQISGTIAGVGGCAWCGGDPANGDWITLSVTEYDPCNDFLDVPCYYLYSELIPQSPDACLGGLYACRYNLSLSFQWVVVGVSYKIVVSQEYTTASPGDGDDCSTLPCGGGADLPFVILESGTLSWTPGGLSAVSISGVAISVTSSSIVGGCDFASSSGIVTVLV